MFVFAKYLYYNVNIYKNAHNIVKLWVDGNCSLYWIVDPIHTLSDELELRNEKYLEDIFGCQFQSPYVRG